MCLLSTWELTLASLFICLFVLALIYEISHRDILDTSVLLNYTYAKTSTLRLTFLSSL